MHQSKHDITILKKIASASEPIDAIWRSKHHDFPIRIIDSEVLNGRYYCKIMDSETYIPLDEVELASP